MMARKIKILIISNTPWNDSNSFGSSFSNIFGGNSNYEIANIFLQPGVPNTSVCSYFFQITEKSIIRSIISHTSSGKEVYNSPDAINHDNGLIQRAKKIRWKIFFWIRDIIWLTGKWKSSALDQFINTFRPNIVFQPIYFEPHINRISIYAHNLTKVPMVGYISDDNYTLKQFSISPLYWIDRLIKRKYVKKVIAQCQILYTITEKQKQEYTQIFGNKCKILYKGGDFDKPQPSYKQNVPLRFIYTGNLGAGRWKTLAEIVKCLRQINKSEEKAHLYIYSQTALPARALSLLDIAGTSSFLGSIPSSQVKPIQQKADVLIHVESFELKERYKARLSFSTKIVDYMESGRCILAVGWEQTGGIEYLKKYNAALIVTKKAKLFDAVNQIVNDSHIRQKYADNAYLCGRKNHIYAKIRNNLYKDLSSLLSE